MGATRGCHRGLLLKPMWPSEPMPGTWVIDAAVGLDGLVVAAAPASRSSHQPSGQKGTPGMLDEVVTRLRWMPAYPS